MRDCRGELLQRVRRGLAADQERLALDAHLATCENCRLTFDVVSDFDQVGIADAGDAERVARIAATARRVYEQRPSRSAPVRSSRIVWPVALAAFVLAGAAVAGGLRWGIPRFEARDDGMSSAPLVVASSVGRPVADPPAAPSRVVVVPEVVPESSARGVPRVRRPHSLPPTASRIYRMANEARRGGQSALAIERYQELQRSFPGSAEAQLSRVSLGGLLLQRGSTESALAQFNAYLSGGSRHRLAPEALYGRGRALQALGRSAEEKQNWRRLIGQYPDSAYATHARRRLDQLR